MSSNRINWFKYSSPATFYPLAGKLVPWFTAIAVILVVVGLYMGFFVAPTDYKQGEGYRIIFVHVPASWMSMFIYLIMAFWAAMGLVFNTRMSGMMVQSLAPTGAMFTFLALWTGAFWGKPMWGTWWVWDARLTSELVLLFLYLGVIGLYNAIDEPRKAARAACLLALVGAAVVDADDGVCGQNVAPFPIGPLEHARERCAGRERRAKADALRIEQLDDEILAEPEILLGEALGAAAVLVRNETRR